MALPAPNHGQPLVGGKPDIARADVNDAASSSRHACDDESHIWCWISSDNHEETTIAPQLKNTKGAAYVALVA